MGDPYGATTIDPAIVLSSLDLAAQQSMAWWTRAMFWTTLASIILSAGALVGLLISLRQTARTIKDTRISNELQNQAYAFISRIDYGDRSPLVAFCKNTGLTPATHFSISATAQIVKVGQITASANFENKDYKTWTRLGPGEETTVGLSVLNDDLIAKFKKALVEQDEVLLICGSLVYCTIYNQDHESQFMFYAYRDSASRFRRPTASIRSFYRIPDPKRSFKEFPTPWQQY
jgi:hypothetical protein